MHKEMLDKIRQDYALAKQIAKDVWIEMDNQGNDNDYYYFECGFVAGLNQKAYLLEKRLEALQKLSDLDQELGLA